jgi:hypothetical protein
MDEQRRLGDKWREGDVEVATSLAVPVGQDKVPSLKCSVTSTPLQGSRQRPLSAPLRGSLHKAPGFAGGYLLQVRRFEKKSRQRQTQSIENTTSVPLTKPVQCGVNMGVRQAQAIATYA